MSKLDVNTLLIFLIIFFSCKDNAKEPAIDLVENEKSASLKTEKEKSATIEIYVWVNKLRLRSEANTKSKIVAILKEGEALKFLKERSDFREKINLRGTLFDEPWLKVSTKSGIEGWVYGGGIKFYKIGIDEAPTPYDDCFKLQKNRRWQEAKKCAKRVQFRELKKASSLVTETDTGINFQLLSGQKFALSNVGNDTIYTFRFYLKEMAFFVIHAKYRTNQAYLLVNDKTGETILTKGFPKASTDGEHIACLNVDWKDKGEFNGIQIFGYINNQFTVVFEQALEDFRPVLPKWVDENALQFTVLEKADKRNKKSRYGQLIRNDKGEWELEF